jgi:hypothetical protein
MRLKDYARNQKKRKEYIKHLGLTTKLSYRLRSVAE